MMMTIDHMFKETFRNMQKLIHQNAVKEGFWAELNNTDTDTQENKLERIEAVNIPEKIALCYSKLSEALEASRQSAMKQDEDCPAFSNFSIELADTVIRIMDLAEACGVPLVEAILARMKLNKI